MAILESLITHQPNPDDLEDSLTRQVTRKMVLLNSRFKHRLEYTECGGATEERIWKKLYMVRSLVVHGVLPDFSKSELRFLGNLEIVGRLVQAATARVMRYALEEPVHMAEVRAYRADLRRPDLPSGTRVAAAMIMLSRAEGDHPTPRQRHRGRGA